MDRLTVEVLGVHFDNLTLPETLERAEGLIAGGGYHYAVTPNAEILCIAGRDPAALTALQSADLVLPDGTGVVAAAKMLKRPIKCKVAGAVFGEALAGRAALTGRSLYILGGRPGIAELAARRLTERFPGLIVAGTADGYYSDEAAVVERINAAAPDILFVATGAPRQEIFMYRNRKALTCRLAVGLGGSVDVYAGVKKRAPRVWVGLGLEWLYYMLAHPKRILRAARLPAFVLAVRRQAASERRGKRA